MTPEASATGWEFLCGMTDCVLMELSADERQIAIGSLAKKCHGPLRTDRVEVETVDKQSQVESSGHAEKVVCSELERLDALSHQATPGSLSFRDVLRS